MHRFYLPPDSTRGTTLLLSGSEAHHALHVLRVRRGEIVAVLNGEGLECECQVEEPAREQVSLRVLQHRLVSPLPYRVTLAQAIPKGKLFESIIQKATELGAARIVPLVTERTIAKQEESEDGAKLAKWRQVAIEAIKQCGSPWLPRVDPPIKVERFVTETNGTEFALVGSLREDAQHPRICLEAFERTNGRKPKSVSIAIGPEGDFTPAELSALQTAGALPITLGPLVLRTETAAIYCLSIINYELQFGLAKPAK